MKASAQSACKASRDIDFTARRSETLREGRERRQAGNGCQACSPCAEAHRRTLRCQECRLWVWICQRKRLCLIDKQLLAMQRALLQLETDARTYARL